jgi:hypothetical protein
MHRLSRLNNLKIPTKSLKKIQDFVSWGKKVQGFIRNVYTTFFGPRFLSQTPYVLMSLQQKVSLYAK